LPKRRDGGPQRGWAPVWPRAALSRVACSGTGSLRIARSGMGRPRRPDREGRASLSANASGRAAQGWQLDPGAVPISATQKLGLTVAFNSRRVERLVRAVARPASIRG
jgi:hypothetical protein